MKHPRRQAIKEWCIISAVLFGFFEGGFYLCQYMHGKCMTDQQISDFVKDKEITPDGETD